MKHSLEIKYGLTAQEMLDAIEKRMRLRVALEGAVAEVHFERKVKLATMEGWLASYVEHDADGMHDFTVTTLSGISIRIEVKTLRNMKKPSVEVQKTRAATSDSSSRFYGRDQFDMLAVCMGRFTGDWSQFLYAIVSELPSHPTYDHKIKVMHAVVESPDGKPRWFSKLKEAMDEYEIIAGL